MSKTVATTDEFADVEVYDKDKKPREAHRMRLDGIAWSVIAQELDYPTANAALVSVRAWLQTTALSRSEDERQEALDMEFDRLDYLQSVAMEQVHRGDLNAIKIVLQVMGHRSKLRGWEQQVEQTGTKMLIISGSTTEEYVAAARRIVEEPLTLTE